MTQHNARFWVFGPGCAPVKITLRPGESVEHSHAWDNGEGWSREWVMWSHRGDHIERARYTSGTDCDGRHSSEQTDICALDRLAHWQDYDSGARLPAWTNRRAAQRDYTAEAMGY